MSQFLSCKVYRSTELPKQQSSPLSVQPQRKVVVIVISAATTVISKTLQLCLATYTAVESWNDDRNHLPSVIQTWFCHHLNDCCCLGNFGLCSAKYTGVENCQNGKDPPAEKAISLQCCCCCHLRVTTAIFTTLSSCLQSPQGLKAVNIGAEITGFHQSPWS